MARLSKNKLTEEHQQELLLQLTSTIGWVNKNLAKDFLSEFFGKEEKVMLAKRLAIIVLLNEKRPIHRIAEHLHTSETTVKNLKDRYDSGQFETTIRVITKNKVDYKKYIDLLDSILTVGGIMPYRNTPIRIPNR
jgi:uncharacterized protein YerC